MSISVTFAGINYTIAEPNDAFTQSMTDYMNAISTKAVVYPPGSPAGFPFLEANTAAGQVIPTAVNTIIVYGSVVTDTDSGWNAGTGRYTVPVGKGGRYFVYADAAWKGAGLGAGSNQFSLYVYRNAIAAAVLSNEIYTPGTTFVAGNSSAGSSILTAVAGDIIDVRGFQNTGGNVSLTLNAVSNRITILRMVS